MSAEQPMDGLLRQAASETSEASAKEVGPAQPAPEPRTPDPPSTVLRAVSASNGEPAVNPQPGRSLVGFYIALGVVAVLVGIFYWFCLRPYLQVRGMVEACYSRRLPKRPLGGLFSLVWTDEEAEDAIRKLGGPSPAARKLVLYMRIPDRLAPTKELAVDLMGHCGSEAVPHLVALLKSENERVRWPAIRGLGRIGDPRAIEPLATLASQDSDKNIRFAAASVLKEIRGEEPPQ